MEHIINVFLLKYVIFSQYDFTIKKGDKMMQNSAFENNVCACRFARVCVCVCVCAAPNSCQGGGGVTGL